jgi:hypothetical protein
VVELMLNPAAMVKELGLEIIDGWDMGGKANE